MSVLADEVYFDDQSNNSAKMMEIPGVEFLLGIDVDSKIYFLTNDLLFNPLSDCINPQVSRMKSRSFVGSISLSQLESDEFKDAIQR